MTDELVPFDDLPDGVQAFLVECFGEAIGQGGGLFWFGTPWTSDDPFKKWLPEPTAETHTLHVRSDGSCQYHDKTFKFWG